MQAVAGRKLHKRILFGREGPKADVFALGGHLSGSERELDDTTAQ